MFLLIQNLLLSKKEMFARPSTLELGPTEMKYETQLKTSLMLLI